MNDLYAQSRTGQHIEAAIILEDQGRGFLWFVGLFLKKRKVTSTECKILWHGLSHVILFSWRNHPQNILLSRFICEEGDGHLQCICPSTSEGALRSLRDVLSVSLSTKGTLPQPALIGPEV